MTGVPLADTAGAVFITVRPALIKRMGNANLAIVWQWIYFRTTDNSPSAYDREGERWWCVNRDEIADETGLRSDQVRRALEALEKEGYLEGAHHALGGPYDRKRSYRCILANADMANLPDASGESATETQPSQEVEQTGLPLSIRTNTEMANLPDGSGESAESIRQIRPMHGANSPDVPLTKEVTSTSYVADATIRPDVLELLKHLDAALARNEVKLPKRNKTNIDAARRLIDIDGRTVDQVKRAIDWATTDSFWRSNILSMSKLRDKYDQLRLNAQRDQLAKTSRPAYEGREEYTPPE
ncbi:MULTISPECIES: hypothetical protein [unclassified Curtobacterium]|uniref:hypothetical protein n=1 Tax=unclassified Curtobacterium TaxID=257496 RepID=UPI003A803AC9